MADFVVIGALALDRPIWLNRPLSPGVRLRGSTLAGAMAGRLGGGAANAGVALARAGHRVSLAAFVRQDPDGAAAIAAAQAAGLETTQVHSLAGRSKTTLILIDPAGERTILGLDLDPEAPPALDPPDAGKVIEGLFVRGGYPGCDAWAKACRGPVVAHWPTGRFEGPCDLLVGSADDCSDAERHDPYAAGRSRMGDRLQWFVMTCGAGDVIAYGPAHSVRVTPPQVKAVDTTGAGDVFAAGLLEAFVAGADIEAALQHACAWGATAVGEEGSAPISGIFQSFRRTLT